jgi:hypothetical protein
LPAVPRLIRLLLVCLLAAAMPLKGMAAVVMLACGAMHGAAATALHGPPGHHGQAGHADHSDHADHAGHAGHQRSAMHGYHGSHGPHAVQAHHAAAADPDHPAQGHHAVPGHHVQAGQADANEAIDAASLQFEHKCAACAACGAAAALPAEPPRFAPAETGPEAFRPLPLSAVRFFTDGPDRPPRTLLA